MGRDIHAHIEAKIGGQWHHYSVPSIERNYGLFAYLSGLESERIDVKAAFPVRGIPDDISVMTRIDLNKWSLDAHTRSHINADEIEQAVRFHEKQMDSHRFDVEIWRQWGWFYGNDFGDREYWPAEIEDVRMVFWFDN